MLAVVIGVSGIVALASCRSGEEAASVSQPPVGETVKLPVHSVLTAAERKAFVGSETCVACHSELKEQVHTRHARSLAPVRGPEHQRRFAAKTDYFDGELNAGYTTRVQGGKMFLAVSSDHGDDETEADYAFGSGAVATTYVSMSHRPPMELRLSSYGPNGEWNITPGQVKRTLNQRPLGKPMDWKTQEECFLCHSTALVRDEKGLDLKASILGIGCETCHGAGRDHVKAAKAGKGADGMVHLGDARSQLSLQVCGQCHRSPDNVNLDDPGQRVQLPRWQALALSMSKCFKKGKVGCTTCHDPHADADARSRAQYIALCASCHQAGQPKQIACRRAPTGDCISCHMPKQEVGMPTNPKFHNHWIKVWE